MVTIRVGAVGDSEADERVLEIESGQSVYCSSGDDGGSSWCYWEHLTPDLQKTLIGLQQVIESNVSDFMESKLHDDIMTVSEAHAQGGELP